MKMIGLIGGISWVSTAEYYRLINEGINEKLGGLNFSQCIIYSFNYADIKRNNDLNDWDATLKMLTEAGQHLERSGAQSLILCANTMHVVAEKLALTINIPIIHIAEVTAAEIKKSKLHKIGLLGTKFTMELDFFTAKLQQVGIAVIIPEPADRAFIHSSIYDELGKGIINKETKQHYLSIINKLIENGAEGIILGCTEIPLLIKATDVSVPTFDTALIHAAAAVEFSLNE